MSCDNPGASTEALMPRRRRFDRTGTCIKCKTTPGRVVIRHAVYCKDCFLVLVTSKFRHVLDPMVNSPAAEARVARGTLRAAGNLMIGFSGGLGSTVLLDLVRRCYFSQDEVGKNRGGIKHPRKSGKVWDRVIVCYVECCNGRQNARDRTEDVEAVLEEYRDIADIRILRLEDAFKASSPEARFISADLSREELPLLQSQPGDPPIVLLNSYLSSLPTPTSRQSTISLLTRLLLQYAASAHGCSHLLLGTSLTSLSVNLIDAVASGAGFTVGLEKAEDWKGPGGAVIRIVRPLREVSLKECAAYLRWRKLSVIGNERMLNEHSNGKEAIGNLTKEFILGLERDYPSTVSAIVRTCDKLVSNTEGIRCVLCERPAETGVQEWKEKISLRRLENVTNALGTGSPEDLDALAPHLCYACHTNLTSRSSRGAHQLVDKDDSRQVKFPAWVGRNADADAWQDRNNMRSHIKDFLLDEDEDSVGT